MYCVVPFFVHFFRPVWGRLARAPTPFLQPGGVPPPPCPLRRTVVDDISFPPLIIPPLFSLISWHRAIDCLSLV